MRKNRAAWLYRIALAAEAGYAFRFGRGVGELRRWFWRHGLIEMVYPFDVYGYAVALSLKGREALRAWSDDAARHGVKL